MSNEFQEVVPSIESKNLQTLREELGGGWSLNWSRVLDSMKATGLSPEIKAELVELVGGYIAKAMEHGQFKNLEGIDPVLDYLGISQIDFDPTALDKIQELYQRYSADFLYSMSPSLYDGKLFDGRDYNRIEYTRELLQKSGEPAEHLTDQYIQDLWRFREVLVHFHNKFRGQTLPPIQKKLTPFIHLLDA